MIQRIQSIWLLLAAIVMVGMFFFPTYLLAETPQYLKNDFVGMILAAVSILLSVITIFQFKKRKSQLNFIWLNLLFTAGLLAWVLVGINNMEGAAGGYRLGAFIPVIVIILLFMARAGIRKDEKLLKSLDRLR